MFLRPGHELRRLAVIQTKQQSNRLDKALELLKLKRNLGAGPEKGLGQGEGSVCVLCGETEATLPGEDSATSLTSPSPYK